MKIKKKVIRLLKRYVLFVACFFLILSVSSGCQNGLTQGSSTEPPVLTNLVPGDLITAGLNADMQSGSIKSILIWQMKDGRITQVDDSQHISKIMTRLSQVEVEKDLGTKEMTLDGYIFKFSVKQGANTRQMIIQVDSVDNFNHVVLGFLADRHFYQLSDKGDEPFDVYFEQEKYK
jgi:hypothetical protein